MHFNQISCISLASHCIFKWRLCQAVMKTSFINNFIISQPILMDFALKLFMNKYLSFQTHLLLDMRFQLYFRTALNYHLSIRFLSCVFLCDCLRQGLLYFYTGPNQSTKNEVKHQNNKENQQHLQATSW